jgi:hypothetical protein
MNYVLDVNMQIPMKSTSNLPVTAEDPWVWISMA